MILSSGDRSATIRSAFISQFFTIKQITSNGKTTLSVYGNYEKREVFFVGDRVLDFAVRNYDSWYDVNYYYADLK